MVYPSPESSKANDLQWKKKFYINKFHVKYANKHILLYNNYDHIIKSLNYIIDYRKQCYVAIMNLSREFELTWIIMP